jgi:hypothetical protein
VSSNPSVATVTNQGVVTGIGAGVVNFTFTETATGCASAAATPDITISQCFNPDFNATFVNITVPGDVSTNDNVAVGTTYGPTPLVVSIPVGAVYTLTVNADGTYTFISNKEGVYKFEVPVCIPPQVSGCPRSDLTITVRDNINPVKMPIANVDIASTKINTAVVLHSLANDGCVVITGCSLNPASVVVTVDPKHGTTGVNSGTGDITYTPNSGFVGMDTLVYKVCVTGEALNCATAKQIITVNSATAGNTTVAADDFAVTPQNTAVSGNVKDNDNDPEGDAQTVTAGTFTATGKGTLVLTTDGAYTFTPVNGFYGPVEFKYTTTDDNASPAVANATLHILVVQDLTIKVRVYLEGALMNNGNVTGNGRPLMRDNLRKSPFNQTRYIPDVDPYRNAIGNLDVTASFTKVAPGNRVEFDTIKNASSVFSDAVTPADAIVDWIFIELRSKSSNTTVLATRSGLVQRDGDVVDLDGVSGLRFPGIALDDYFVVVRHLRHLGSMTASAQTPLQLTTLVNFTTAALPTYDMGVKTYGPTGNQVTYDFTGLAQKTMTISGLNYRALWAGDFDSNGKIKNDNPDDDLNALSFNVTLYPNNVTFNANYDFAYGYLHGDYDMNSKAKFDNPNDDKNMLYGQLLFYPLNTSLLSNFDFFIEQLPKP